MNFSESRSGEILDSAIARAKAAGADKGFPLEVRASIVAAFKIALELDFPGFHSDPKHAELRKHFNMMVTVLDPELFIKNTAVFTRVSKAMLADMRDLRNER